MHKQIEVINFRNLVKMNDERTDNLVRPKRPVNNWLEKNFRPNLDR
jgi:hypothetical protein